MHTAKEKGFAQSRRGELIQASNFSLRIILLAGMMAFSCSGFSQSEMADLKVVLEKTNSLKVKADVCFRISLAYTDSLKVDSAIYFADKVNEYSRQENYKTGIGKYHLALAKAIFLRGRNNEVEENALKAIEIFSRQKEFSLSGSAYIILANAQYVSDKISSAQKNYWTAIAIFKPQGNVKGLYSAYWWLARTYYKTSETDSASFYFINALSVAEQLNDPEKISISGAWAGKTFLSLGDPRKAISYFENALQPRKGRIDKVGLRIFLRDYANCLILTQEFSKADSVIKEVEEINAKLKDGYGVVIINRLRGTLEYERKNYQQAVAFLRQAISKMNELKVENSERKDVLLLLGKSEYETHQYGAAVNNLRVAAQMSRGLRESTDEKEAVLFISKSMQQNNNIDSALYYFKYYTVLKDSIQTQQKQKNIIEIATRYETEKKEQEIKMLGKEQEASLYLLRLKSEEIEKQNLEDEKKSQQLLLFSQQSEINRLTATEKEFALQKQEKDILKKQGQIDLLGKEKEIQAIVAARENRQKNIAYAAGGIIFLLGGYALHRARQSRKLSRELATSLEKLKSAQEKLINSEKEKEAESIRSRISRDIHDEVGATLSGVALYSQIAQQKMEERNDEEVQLYLNHISVNAKEMVEKMSDVVWAINPENDSIERIVAKLKSFAINLCSGQNIHLRFDVDDEIVNYFPLMQERKNIYLISKEAINNAVKYSASNNISISLQKRSTTMLLTIKDDGKGFNNSTPLPGNGLKNMKIRATEMNGFFNIQSEPGAGTEITLEFAFHPNGGQAGRI